MTESEKDQTRSRRRFLADVLFIGGGLSAAAILAKTQIFDKQKKQCPPDIAGDMIPPEPPPPHPTGAAPLREIPAETIPSTGATPEQPPMPGEPMPVQASPSPQTTPSPFPEPAGEPMAPKHEGGR